MKKIIFLATNYRNITGGNIYDVTGYIPNKFGVSDFNMITIIDDVGVERSLTLFNNNILFKDVTLEYRNIVIDEILN